MRALGTALLSTDRLLLRKIKEGDYEAMFHKWASREECSRYFPWHPVTDMNLYKNRVASWIEQYENGTYFQWIIELKETQELIGIINLHNVDEDNNSAETSYILMPEYWGKRIMTEALSCVLNYAFSQIGLHRVSAEVFVGNIASEKVLQKCEMVCEGTNREKYLKDGKYIDIVQYAKIRV